MAWKETTLNGRLWCWAIGKLIRNFAAKITSFQIAVRYRCLELLFDDILKFDRQVAKICRKVSRHVAALIKRMRNVLPFEVRKNIYFSFVAPHFDYCAQTWHFCNREPFAWFFDTNILHRKNFLSF